MQETRLTAAGQRAMNALAKTMGWQVVWGALMAPKGDGT